MEPNSPATRLLRDSPAKIDGSSGLTTRRTDEIVTLMRHWFSCALDCIVIGMLGFLKTRRDITYM